MGSKAQTSSGRGSVDESRHGDPWNQGRSRHPATMRAMRGASAASSIGWNRRDPLASRCSGPGRAACGFVEGSGIFSTEGSLGDQSTTIGHHHV
jgi:hypothetical protein